MTPDELLGETGRIIRETVLSGPVAITRDTRAADVRGWDSLSHTIVLMNLEDRFGVRMPMERVLSLRTVGELVDLIAELTSNADAT
jgi:acyl carrier protein